MIKDVEMPMFEFPSREVMDDLTTFLEKVRPRRRLGNRCVMLTLIRYAA